MEDFGDFLLSIKPFPWIHLHYFSLTYKNEPSDESLDQKFKNSSCWSRELYFTKKEAQAT